MGFVLFIFNLLVAGVLLFRVMNARASDASRGTNTVTRFVRDVGSNVVYTTTSMIAVGATIVFLLIGLLADAPYACIPTVAMVAVPFIFRFQSNRNQQRVKDARVVTKTTGKVVAKVGTDAVALGCVAAAPATGGASLAAVAAAKGACNVLDKSMDQMTDVEGPDIQDSDFEYLHKVSSVAFGVDFHDPDKFMEACQRVGIPTQGQDLGAIAMQVIDNAPTAFLEKLPETMSIEDKAMAVLGGTVESKQGEEVPLLAGEVVE